MVVAASPGLRRAAGADEGMIEDSLVQRPEGFPNGAVLFDVDEVADTGPHLALGLLDEHGGGNAFQCRSCGAGDGVDVSGYESVVGNGSNHLFHNRVCVCSCSVSDTNIRQISLICKY